ncbi:Na+/H+ antiporter NhaC family protein [Allofournierella sp.]|uniref:Na+/H+ antiporter NhaC family protein n=1 Tax=Allofournierella sp. TaxID=1940256 RepID=UPI003AB6DBB4
MEDKNRLTFRGSMFLSLIPVGIFFGFCIVLFVVFKAFNMEALAAGGFIALLIGGLFCKSYSKFWDSAIRGISSVTSVSVIVIFFVIGMFSGLMKQSGLSGGFVWLANSVGLKGGAFVAFVFFATCVVSTATGSSIGTMFTAFPIFYPAGLLLGCSPMFLAGAIVSGAIFGDNLAPISDTTIASASTQQFRDGRVADIGGVVSSRLKYSAVAGAISLVLFAVLGGMGGVYQGGAIEAAADPKSLVMLIPVAVMLIVATKTRNIFQGILVGLVLGTATGLALGLFTPADVFSNDAANSVATGFLVTGVANMLGTVGLVISVFGIMGVLADAGMLEYLVDRILGSRMARTARGAELACLLGVSATTVIFGGVTSASILTFGPVLNKIGTAKGIHPYRRANILDGIANSLPAIVPFMSVFVFIGVACTGLSPLAVAGGTIYAFALFATLLVSIITGWGRRYEGPKGEAEKEEPAQAK